MSNSDRILEELGSRITDLLEEEDIFTDKIINALSGVTEENFPSIDCADKLSSSFTNSEIDALRIVQTRYIDIYGRAESRGVAKKTPYHGQKAPPKYKEPGFDVPVGSLLNDSPSVVSKHSDLYYELTKSEDKKIGHALIIINKTFLSKNREGADKDKDNLIEMFRDLGIEYFVEYDLHKDEMEKKIGDFAKNASKQKASVVFVCMSSHGAPDGIFAAEPYSSEDKITVIKIQQLLTMNEVLKDIPKILVLQACRGEADQKLGEVSKIKEENIVPSNFAVISNDILILYPTSLYFAALRDTEKGSWMIDELAKSVKEYKDSLHFIEILTICTYNILHLYETPGHKKETCTFKSTLTKFLSFKPK